MFTLGFTSRRTRTWATPTFSTRGTRSTSMPVLFSVTSRHVFVAIRENNSMRSFHPTDRRWERASRYLYLCLLVSSLPSFLWAHCMPLSNFPSQKHAHTNLWVRGCLVPRPQYYASVIRFGSRGPGRSSEIRHQNQLTVKAWEKAVRELGKVGG